MEEGSDCPSGKRQYTKLGAREVRDGMRRRGLTGRDEKSYHCMYCGTYHLGSAGRSKRDRYKARMGLR